MSDLSGYTLRQLLDEIERRVVGSSTAVHGDGSPASPCCCGSARREVVESGSELFERRTGCTNCNVWDQPVRLRAR